LDKPHKTRLLLVEDNPPDSRLITALLKQIAPELEVAVVRDGEQAIDQLLVQTGEPFTAVLLDLNLPRKTGLEVLAEMRSLPKLRDLPVFILTTSNFPEDRERAEALGVISFLEKPTELTELESSLTQLALVQLPKLAAGVGRARMAAESFRLLVEAVKEYAIFMLDPTGHIVTWNSGAQRIKGYEAGDILGKHFSVFYTQEAKDRRHPDYELKVAGEMGVYEEEGVRVRKDGTTFWANVVITALRDPGGTLVGFAKVTRDITERKKAERAIRQLNADLERRVADRTRELEESKLQLEAQREELLRSNADLRQFAYVASHDLQEPLRMVIGYLQLLQKTHAESLDPQAKECVEVAINGARRMRLLVQDLLTYARIQRPIELPKENVPLKPVVDEALDNLARAIEESGCRITVDPLPEVKADPLQLLQVYQNLIANAIAYRKPGRSLEIRVGMRPSANGHWTFYVQDNGIGINPEYFSKIFVIFQRLHSDREQYPGTGIGLSICKKIVERHRGKIWVESTPGEGSTFLFSLPK
jgi:PAS domain S-box-containing protein